MELFDNHVEYDRDDDKKSGQIWSDQIGLESPADDISDESDESDSSLIVEKPLEIVELESDSSLSSLELLSEEELTEFERYLEADADVSMEEIEEFFFDENGLYNKDEFEIL